MPSRKPAARPLASDALPLAIQAAVGHPDAAVRQKTRTWLDDWVEGLEPRYDAESVRSVLLEAKGTVVEPFSLSARDMDIAVLATRAALSKRIGHQRFRVVSSETIGLSGGLVLTSNLNSYYVERVVWGKHRNTPWRTSFVAPGSLPATTAEATSARAICRLTPAALQIDVPAWCWQAGDALGELVRSLEVSGLRRAEPLSGRELSIALRGDHVRLESRSPESLIRLTAMAERAEFLALSSPVKSAVHRVLIALSPVESDDTELRVFTTQTSRSTRQWAGFWSDVALPVPVTLRRAIATAYPMHDRWATPAFLKALS